MMLEIFSEDFEYITEKIVSSPNQTDFRSIVHLVCARIESFIYRQKHLAKHLNNLFLISKKDYQRLPRGCFGIDR
jgi:hypothetical protein